jgi:hypothetical protein
MSHAFIGRPLEYYGELSGLPWPQKIKGLYRRPGGRELTIEERFNSLDFSPEYFIVTDFNQLDRYHPDMKEYLRDHCPVVAQSKDYLIYAITRDNCRHASFRSDHLGQPVL